LAATRTPGGSLERFGHDVWGHDQARRLRYGEIEISIAHTAFLRQALRSSAGTMSAIEADWTARVGEMLQAIDEEPTIYLMVKRTR